MQKGRGQYISSVFHFAHFTAQGIMESVSGCGLRTEQADSGADRKLNLEENRSTKSFWMLSLLHVNMVEYYLSTLYSTLCLWKGTEFFYS